MIKKTLDKIITGLLVLPNLRQGNGTEVPIAVQEDGLLVKGSGSSTVNWTDVQDKPTEFPPSAHTHDIGDINGLQGELDDKQDASSALQIGTTATTAKAGNYQPTWAQVTSKPTTFPPSSHTHPFSEVTGTATAAQIPTLAISKISGLQGELDGKLTATQGGAVADAVADPVTAAEFNALLASLRTAGIIAT